MKKLILMFAALAIISCNGKADNAPDAIANDSTTIAKPEIKDIPQKPLTYLTSTFDDPEFAGKIKEVQDGLAELDSAGVFDSLWGTQHHKLTDRHFGYLKGIGRRYKLIYAAPGSLFAKGQKDMAFILYDIEQKNITLMLLNQKEDWGALYQDYKVATGLENANCNYGMFGTLDYILASELVYLKDSLIKDPKSLLELMPCMITNFAKDENFTPENCCFAKGFSKKDMANSLCIATSFVYNSWECLKYNPTTKSFTIYYGQTWAD